MKNTIFLLFSIFSLSAFTQSAIMVTSYDLPFILFSNDRQINSQPQKQVTVRNISGETCRLYLTFEDRSIPPVKKMVFTNPIDKDMVRFRLVRKGRRRIKYKLRHGGWGGNPAPSNYTSNSSPNRNPSSSNNYPAVPALENVPTKGNGVTDIEGNYYPSIVINGVEWMSENLRTTKFSDGSEIPRVLGDNEWTEAGSIHKPAYCWVQNDPNYAITYGNMYNWFVVDDSRKVCPQGWKVPSRVDVEKMISSLGGNSSAGRHMKTKGEAYWKPPGNLQTNQFSTNQSGFNARGSGSRFAGGGHSSFKTDAYYWCADVNNDTFDATGQMGMTGAQYYRVTVFDDQVNITDYWMNAGFAIRCIKE